jgi:hypothetical protein
MTTGERLTQLDLSTISLAMDIAHATVWCSMTTVDAKGRPRSRIVHPVWVLEDDTVTGWLTTRRTPVKSAHLAANQFVSLAYIAQSTGFAYFDCRAEWVEDAAGKANCWNAFLEAPDPARYDPANIWPDGPRSDTFEALRFTPYRVQAARAEQIARGERAGLVRLG